MRPLLAIVGCVLVGCAGPKPERIVLTDSAIRSAQAEVTGPTINLQTNSDKPPTNPLSSLMYFIRLTSNEPVELTQSEGNTQQAQLTKIDRQSGGRKFTVTCQFEFIGEGSQMNRFDHSATIQNGHRNWPRARSCNGGLLISALPAAGAAVCEFGVK